MKQIMMSIFDHVSKVWSQPHFVVNKAVGLRAFQVAANDPLSVIGKNPGDFTCFFIGTFNDETGELTRMEPFESGGLASAYVQRYVSRDGELGEPNAIPRKEKVHDSRDLDAQTMRELVKGHESADEMMRDTWLTKAHSVKGG